MPKVSIVLVHYKVRKVLYDCIRSIYASHPKTSFEIIVVDNDEVKKVGPQLRKNFPKVKYIPASGNLGYGKGNNLGVGSAGGEYIFVLNPDTIVAKGTIDKLLRFIKSKKEVGIVAPTLYDEKGKMYPLQGTKELTPLRGIFALSFLNKLFPKNPISKDYWLGEVDRSKPFEVDVVPGSAFLIKKSLFEDLGGFDPKFFLYFEETDFCKRVREAGYKLFIDPEAKLTHFWAVSTPPSEKLKKVFAQSRFYYFKKNFGLLNALVVEFFARVNKWNMALFAILALGTFLRFYQIKQNLIFNGEMGYDYITIKNFVENHQIPLIGPRTSHEWFFIGPLFYWMFGIFLPLMNWSVLSGAIFMAVVGIFSLWVCYRVIGALFGKKVGVISSFLLSISPAWVRLARDARFNSLTALLFFPFLYFLVKAIEGGGKSLFVLGLTLGAMFSFFPSPILLLPGVLVTLFIYRKQIENKYLPFGVLGFIVPNIPYLIYNAQYRFEIILNLFAWIPYRILGFFGFYPKNTADAFVIKENFLGLYNFFQQSWLYKDSVLILLLFFGVFTSILFAKKSLSLKVLLFVSLVSYLGLFVHGNPPAHYYLVIFPVPLIFLAIFLERLGKKSKLLVFLILFGLAFFNLKYYFSDKWFYIDSDKVSSDYHYVPYKLQKEVADFIVKDVEDGSFSIARVGPYDYFRENFSLNYQYLIQLDRGKIDTKAKLRYTIYEDTTSIPRAKKVYWFSNMAVTKEAWK